MPDFNQSGPPVSVTNPDKAGTPANAKYPRHVHAKNGKYRIVQNEKEEAAALKKGYSLVPVHESWTAWGEPDVTEESLVDDNA